MCRWGTWGTLFKGGLGSAELMVGLNHLKVLFPANGFYAYFEWMRSVAQRWDALRGRELTISSHLGRHESSSSAFPPLWEVNASLLLRIIGRIEFFTFSNLQVFLPVLDNGVKAPT